MASDGILLSRLSRYVHSCKTIDQLRICERYVDLMIKYRKRKVLDVLHPIGIISHQQFQLFHRQVYEILRDGRWALQERQKDDNSS